MQATGSHAEFHANMKRSLLTLSKPAMFWFSAKNSAGLLNCTVSPRPLFFPLLAILLQCRGMHSTSCSGAVAGRLLAVSKTLNPARCKVCQLSLYRCATDRNNHISKIARLIHSSCRSFAPHRPGLEPQAQSHPVLRWGAWWQPAPWGSP